MKTKTKRRIAKLLSFLMMFSLIMGVFQAEVNADQEIIPGNLTFTFDDTSSTYGEVQWKDSENEWHTQEKDGTVDATAVKVVYANGGTLASQTELRVGGEATLSTNKTALESTDGLTLDSNTSYAFEHIQFVAGMNGDGGQNPPALTNPKTITVNITAGTEYLDTFGTNLKVDDTEVADGSVTVEQAETHVISVLPQFGYSISAKINGNIVSGTLNDGWYSYTVNEADTYNIELTNAGNSVCTVAWAYGDTYGEDGKVTNGSVKIISAVLPDGRNGIGEINIQDENEGHVVIEPGSLVTVEIKPDYGYQFLEGSLNGETITAGTEVSTFTFIMPSTNLHLSALFTKTDDVINAESTQVSNGSIANGEKVVDSGNLKLEIKDLTAEQIAAVDTPMKEKAGADEIQLYLDMDLYNFVNKGTAADAWNDKMTDLDGNLTVTLNLSDELKGKDGTFYVIREHDEADGTKSYTKIAATYDKATGTISFATNKFSTYALVLGKGKDVNTTDPASNALKANLAEDAKLADKVLTPQEQASGGTVSLTVQDITKTVSAADKTLVESKLGGAALGMYLDFGLTKVVSGRATPITETISPVTIRLTLPTSLINTDTTKVRTYQMIRVHDFGAGPVAETLPCTFDAATGTMSFETKYYSTYALIYSDATVPVSPSDSPSEDTTTDAAVKDAVPNTGDTGSTVLWYVVAVISGLGAVYFGTEKKKYTK